MVPGMLEEVGFVIQQSYPWGITTGPAPKKLGTINKLKKECQRYLNARSNKFLESGDICNTVRHQRCFVPVTRLFEYRKIRKADEEGTKSISY